MKSIQELKKLLFVPLTNFDLERYIGKNKIVKFSDIDEMQNIDQLLPNPKDFRIILFQTTSDSSGHWICICRDDAKKEYVFFDSYGNKLGTHTQRFNTSHQNKLLGIEDHALKNLLKTRKKGMKIISNPYRLQSLSSGSETCGRFCVLFLKMYLDGGYTLEQFKDFIDDAKVKLKLESRDLVSCYYIN